MILTRIGDKNYEYFAALIDRFYDEAVQERFYIGVVDDDDIPVAAAVFEEAGDIMILRYIAVVKNRRREGIGRFLLDNMRGRIADSGVHTIMATFFAPEGEEDKMPSLLFFRSMGFEQDEEETGLRRSIYPLEEVIESVKMRGYKEYVRRPDELSAEVRESLSSIDDIDEDEIMGSTNRYGGVLIKNGRAKAAIAVTDMYKGVRISAIASDGDLAENMKYLYAFAAARIAKEAPEKELLYIDTLGKKLMAYEDRFMKEKGVQCTERHYAVSMEMEV